MGRSNTSNRLPTASIADAIFFPTRPELRLGERAYSPDFQQRLTETAARTKSFQQASAIATIWSGQAVSSRNLGRVAEEVGRELVDQRDAEVDDFTHHRRGPEGADPRHELAAVFVDGGRIQVRDETPGLGPGVHHEAWKEDKIGRLQTMASKSHLQDPCPEPPSCFLKPMLSGTADSAKSPANAEELAAFLDAPPPPVRKNDWQPKPLVRTCVGTMEPLEQFRWMIQAEAKRRHFYTAQKRAFVADGAAGNWTLRDRHFPDFVPILDFMHVAEYLHDAAKALGSATLGVEWVRDLWQGRGTEVIARLRETLDLRGIGEEPLDEKHESFAVQRAWTYLSNNVDKIDYPRYRRDGLPTTSSLIESQVKEFNARMKGSEKFWYESNAEAVLQLICWTLRDDGPTLADHFDTRPASPFRRSYLDVAA